eukprot:symbB.v1.2.007601.t1/scaffold460.1/size201776/8
MMAQMGVAVVRILCWLACLALAKSLDRGFPASVIDVEVDDKATFRSGLRAVSGKGLNLAGGAALQQLESQPTSGCQHLTNLVHTLQRSKALVSTEEAPLSYMHVDHPVYQVGLAVFDLWEDPPRHVGVQTLDEDASQVLQPFLPDVAMWREACSSSDKARESTKTLLVLAGVKEPPEINASMWSEMAKEFGAYVTRKVLRKRPHEVHLWQPTKDDASLAELLSKKNQECFRSVAVLSGAPWDFAWSQHFRCNVKEGRLVLHFVEQFMQANPMESQKMSHDTAQVCFAEGNMGNLQRLELCQLTGREVRVQVAPSAMEMTRCDVFLALPGTAPTGAELWLGESSSLVEILSQTKMPTTFVENLALLTGAKHFTLQRGEPTEANDEIEVAARAILALNRAGVHAVDGSLDESIDGASELEGCEEFYYPEDGWMQGWRDVARSLKVAQGGETIGRAPEDEEETADSSRADDLEDETSQTAKSEEDRDDSAAQEEDDVDKKAESEDSD